MKCFPFAAPILFGFLSISLVGCGGSRAGSGSDPVDVANNGGNGGTGTAGSSGAAARSASAGISGKTVSSAGTGATAGKRAATGSGATAGAETGARAISGSAGRSDITGSVAGSAGTSARVSEPSAGAGGRSPGPAVPPVSGAGLHAVIIKAAGYVGQAGPDRLSSATTEPYNTHVFADVLAQHLGELGVKTAVIDWVDCEKVSCVHVPDADSTADIVVFAGVTYDGNLPEELRNLVPLLGQLSPAPKITSGLSSCNRVPGIDAFMTTLRDAGLANKPGIALQGASGTSLTDEQMHSVLSDFALQLVESI